jgi:hypothetical protein
MKLRANSLGMSKRYRTYECHPGVKCLHEIGNIGKLEDGQQSMLVFLNLVFHV